MKSKTLSRRQFINSCIATGATVSLNVCCGKKKPLNFIFFLVDDLGWKDLGCFGSSFYETANIDTLAATAMRFTQAYAACPVCSPTRASIMTGKYPARMGTTDWFGAPQPETAKNHWTRNKPLLPAPYVDRLPLSEITMAEALKQHGYQTFFAGKWHLGREGYYPEEQGFDINKGGTHAGSPPGGYFSPYKNPKLTNGPDGEHLPDRLAGESVAFLEQAGNNPFLLYLSFYSVHIPLQARPDLQRKYEQKAAALPQDSVTPKKEGDREVRQIQNHAAYAAMIEAMDQAVGKVLTALDRLGLTENTAVIFMSDNGGLASAEGSPTSNVPLRAGKGWLYEGGIREPMIIRWPGVTRPGSLCPVPVISTDFYPTMLDMAGLPLKPEQHMDGRSMMPLLKGSQQPLHDALYWHYPHYGNQGGSPGSVIRQGDYKLILFYEDRHVELYDLSRDMGESHNLADEKPVKAAELLHKLEHWLAEVDAKRPSHNPNAQEG